MDTPENDRAEVDARLDELIDRGGELLRACRFRSAFRVYGEVRRLARAEQRALPYLIGLFHQMDVAADLLEPMTRRELVVELIALLESEDRARLLQPDLPEEQFNNMVEFLARLKGESVSE